MMFNPVVLIAEDDTDTRETLRQLLHVEGFEVIGAEDSILAYSTLAATRPDVIVVDVMMPKVDGIGLIC
ncbi:MAG TPA: response regulator [Blastocatellia bacterium]|nr:response regulator [Blastocatellia bacterium]